MTGIVALPDSGGTSGGTLEKLTSRHKSLLDEASESFKELQNEIGRLEDELAAARLSQAKIVRATLHGKNGKRPPLPALPGKIEIQYDPDEIVLPPMPNALQDAPEQPEGSPPTISSPAPSAPTSPQMAPISSAFDAKKSYMFQRTTQVTLRTLGGIPGLPGSPGLPNHDRMKSTRSLLQTRFSTDEAMGTWSSPRPRLHSSYSDKMLIARKLFQKNRLNALLMDKSGNAVASSELHTCLVRRGLKIPLEVIQDVFDEITRLLETDDSEFAVQVGETRAVPEDCVPTQALETLMANPDLQVHFSEVNQPKVAKLVKVLTSQTVEELVERATKTGLLFNESCSRGDGQGAPRWETPLNIMVFFCVFVSLLVMGTSIDFYPGNPVWLIIEGFCCFVFVVEVIFKLHEMGTYEFFTGPFKLWNTIDFVITSLSVIDIIMSVAEQVTRSDTKSSDLIPNASAITRIVRILRVTRAMRLLKLMKSPYCRDLVNMLIGLAIGAHALLSVLVIFCLVLYIIGLIFRITIGPAEGQDLLSVCEHPDNLDDFSDPVCKIHVLYGEVYFNSVKASMFTLFRFMMGDFTSYNGNSLALAFSEGYGDKFRVVFCSGMISVYFGLFNIITAVFVDSTISGLKHNDVKKKQARQMERQIVTEKLHSLVERILILQGPSAPENSTVSLVRRTCRVPIKIAHPNLDDVLFSEDEFTEVMQDAFIKTYLQELDIAGYSAQTLFETFDPGKAGRISLPDMIEGLMRLRGEPSKNDLIASWVAIRSLHSKVDMLHDQLKRKSQVQASMRTATDS